MYIYMYMYRCQYVIRTHKSGYHIWFKPTCTSTLPLCSNTWVYYQLCNWCTGPTGVVLPWQETIESWNLAAHSHSWLPLGRDFQRSSVKSPQFLFFCCCRCWLTGWVGVVCLVVRTMVVAVAVHPNWTGLDRWTVRHQQLMGLLLRFLCPVQSETRLPCSLSFISFPMWIRNADSP